MICRRRLSLRVVFIASILFLILIFLTSVIEFSEIDESRKSHLKKNEQVVYHGQIESEIERFQKLENFKDKFSNRFNNRLEKEKEAKGFNGLLGEFNNRKVDMNQYENADLESIVNLEFAKAVDNMEKIVHLDLKGAPPKLSYLKEFIPFIKKLGATGVLIEYEDFFPYESDLDVIKNQNHYTKQELNLLFDIISENELKLIPLIQTYGHLEFVLKLKQFAYLRENKLHFQVITPCLADTYEKVLFRMIDQILDSHPKTLDYLHIGCDEVYHINTNPSCANSASLSHLKTTEDFFIYHVTKLVNYIKSKNPNLKVIIWDDMIRKHMIPNVSEKSLVI